MDRSDPSGLSSWRDSWSNLRERFETESLACPPTKLFLWKNPDFSPGDPSNRLSDELRLSELWLREGWEGESEQTKVPRLFAMGLGTLHSFGPYTWAFMSESVARIAQQQGQGCDELDRAIEQARQIEQTFINLAEHASDLLLRAPKGAEIALCETATGYRLWVLFLFQVISDDAGLRRLSGFMPIYVPANCRSASGLDLHVFERNPFLESVAAIDWLIEKLATIAPADSIATLPVTKFAELLQIKRNNFDGGATIIQTAEDPLADRILKRIKNNPILATLIVLGIITIGLGTFTEELQKMVALLRTCYSFLREQFRA